MNIWDHVQTLDVASLRAAFDGADGFRHLVIDEFLRPDFASEIASAYPQYDTAEKLGHEFRAVNEAAKVQVTESSHFPEPVMQLHRILSDREWLATLERITGIESLLADPELAGGGMHVMAPGGRLDVHVDFNYVEERELHRRLNILVFLNPGWRADWGGLLELWDPRVRTRAAAFEPMLNRCVLFETSEISFHGVTPIHCPPDQLRRSFAAYYYTSQPPPAWDGRVHSTIFRPRPGEGWRQWLLVPLDRARQRLQNTLDRARARLRR